MLDRILRLKKKKRIDSLSRILKKLFSTFIFPRISVRFFILHNRSLRSAILLSNNVRTIVFGAASTVESETSPFFFLSFFVFFGEISVRKGSGYNNTRTIFLHSCSDAEQRRGLRYQKLCKLFVLFW